MGSKRVGILAEFNYEDLELWYPYYRLKEEGYDTFTIGPEKGKTYNSKHGYPCKAQEGIDDIKAEDLAALIIPGGFAPDYWRRDKRFLDLVKQMYESDRNLDFIQKCNSIALSKSRNKNSDDMTLHGY